MLLETLLGIIDCRLAEVHDDAPLELLVRLDLVREICTAVHFRFRLTLRELLARRIADAALDAVVVELRCPSDLRILSDLGHALGHVLDLQDVRQVALRGHLLNGVCH